MTTSKTRVFRPSIQERIQHLANLAQYPRPIQETLAAYPETVAPFEPLTPGSGGGSVVEEEGEACQRYLSGSWCSRYRGGRSQGIVHVGPENRQGEGVEL